MQNVKKIPWEINGIFLRTRLLSITITDDIFPVYDRDKRRVSFVSLWTTYV